MFIIIVFEIVLAHSSSVSSQDFYCSLPRDRSRHVTLAWEFLLFSSVLPFAYASSFRLLLLRLCSNRCAEALALI